MKKQNREGMLINDLKKIVPYNKIKPMITVMKDEGIDFFSNIWEVSHWQFRKSTTSKKHLFFKSHTFVNFEKFFLVLLHYQSMTKLKKLYTTKSYLKTFFDFLSDRNIHNINCLDEQVMMNFENYIFTKKRGNKTKSAGLFTIFKFLKVLDLQIDWVPPKIDCSKETTSSHYIRNMKEKRVPETVIEQLLLVGNDIVKSVKKR